MKFLLRSFIVLAIAVGAGVVLYYAVQALPGDSPTSNPPGIQLPPENGRTPSQNLPPRPERPENDGGFRLRSIFGIASRALMFSVLVFVAVLAKNLLFEKKSDKKNTAD